MAYRWPVETAFKRIDVDVEDRSCPVCERYMHVCDHRYHHLWTFEVPTQVVNRLVRCPDPWCASRGRTFSPEAEVSISMPRWSIGWDVFCWLGHRRFARHWSVPQLPTELQQIPSDLVVKSQGTDIIDLILQLIRHPNGAHRACHHRKSRGAVLSTSEVQ